MTYSDVHIALQAFVSPERTSGNARFFKTGVGEYGEGDVFLGITMPDIRRVVKRFRDAPRRVIIQLCTSQYHEERMCGLLIIVDQYERADEADKRDLFRFYVTHRALVNNWDLVDVTTPPVVGAWLLSHPDDMIFLDEWVISDSVWERRMAMLAMQPFIVRGRFDDPIRVARCLLHDKHDLIHKAVGWMLREIGKKDVRVLRQFLDEHADVMPRTMLRYATEQLSSAERQRYMKR